MKRLTKRQKKEQAKFLKELTKSQIKVVAKPQKNKAILTLTEFLAKQAQKKHDKKHERQERANAKPALLKAAAKAAKEAKRAKKAARAAKVAEQNAL